MARFLIDVNLPYRFAFWTGNDFFHVRDLDERWSDSQVWSYARERGLVIVSKDADFSDRALISQPPPRVVRIRYGSMNTRDFHGLIKRQWPMIVALSVKNRLVRAYVSRFEAIE
jgi:predicted nuclease of predicted toxin-antitoxin system